MIVVLSMYQDLALNTLKVDHDFNKGIECDNSGAAITEAIIAMAQEPGYTDHQPKKINLFKPTYLANHYFLMIRVTISKLHL